MNSPRIVVLEYHDIVTDHNGDSSGIPGQSAASYKLRQNDFERHLMALAGLPVVLAHAAEPRGEWLELGRPYVLITFDDGGISALSEAAPRLERHGWRGHFFVTTDWIGRRGFLSGGDIAELSGRGHLIGSHSCSHPARFAHCTRQQMMDEWRRSRDVLEDAVGADVQTASVPGGYFSRMVAETAAEAGYTALFTSEPSTKVDIVNGCRVYGRFTLRNSSPARRAAALARGRALPRAAEWAKWEAKSLLKTAGGSAYLRVRRFMFRDSVLPPAD